MINCHHAIEMKYKVSFDHLGKALILTYIILDLFYRPVIYRHEYFCLDSLIVFFNLVKEFQIF